MSELLFNLHTLQLVNTHQSLYSEHHLMTIQIIITLINTNSGVTTQTIRNKSSLVNKVLQKGSRWTPMLPWVSESNHRNLCNGCLMAELLIPSSRLG